MCGLPHIRFRPAHLFWPYATPYVRIQFAEGPKKEWGLFSLQAKKIEGFFCNFFDKFMLNFFVAFLFEGTKFKLMTFFSVRGRNKASKAHKYRGIGGFNDSNGSLSTI